MHAWESSKPSRWSLRSTPSYSPSAASRAPEARAIAQHVQTPIEEQRQAPTPLQHWFGSAGQGDPLGTHAPPSALPASDGGDEDELHATSHVANNNAVAIRAAITVLRPTARVGTLDRSQNIRL